MHACSNLKRTAETLRSVLQSCVFLCSTTSYCSAGVCDATSPFGVPLNVCFDGRARENELLVDPTANGKHEPASNRSVTMFLLRSDRKENNFRSTNEIRQYIYRLPFSVSPGACLAEKKGDS